MESNDTRARKTDDNVRVFAVNGFPLAEVANKRVCVATKENAVALSASDSGGRITSVALRRKRLHSLRSRFLTEVK